MFQKILIANRGEIACRIIKTCKTLGVSTVVVYSDTDKNSLAVQLADEAVALGGVEAADTYLDQNKIIQTAKDTGAEAIHPGFGFLSENAGFARAVGEAGLTFIGPLPEAITRMGSKVASRELMQKAGVPLLPASAAKTTTDGLEAEAAAIGFPLLIKASAGGGGKGMRLVEDSAELLDSAESVMREAQAAFGDATFYLEKYVQKPRHVEVQVFGDTQGTVVHLGTRDCSLQRRHQKVVEECPAPGLPQETLEALGETAVTAAKAVNYINAGTVEFIFDPQGQFYFLEMNTRLQVEHGVTELVTGLDLVEKQLQVASGKPLGLGQKDISFSGHALEVRLYAEDPYQDFLPATGKISLWEVPEHLGRVDTGVGKGASITPYFDPMLAKLLTHGKDREEAIDHMDQMLAQTAVHGLKHNLGFLRMAVAHPDFAKGDVHTGFIPDHAKELLTPPEFPAEALAAVLTFEAQKKQTGTGKRRWPTPWQTVGNWGRT